MKVPSRCMVKVVKVVFWAWLFAVVKKKHKLWTKYTKNKQKIRKKITNKNIYLLGNWFYVIFKITYMRSWLCMLWWTQWELQWLLSCLWGSLKSDVALGLCRHQAEYNFTIKFLWPSIFFLAFNAISWLITFTEILL